MHQAEVPLELGGGMSRVMSALRHPSAQRKHRAGITDFLAQLAPQTDVVVRLVP
jgi:hypothetical protein